jgi:hypothetical protein
MKPIHPQKGFAVLLSVLVLAAAGVALCVSLLYLSINAAQTAGTFQESMQANGLANACAEVALQKLVTTSSFTGTGSLTLGQGTCTYTVATGSGSTDSIKSTGTVGMTVRKVQITIAIPQLTVSLWQEVGDFN